MAPVLDFIKNIFAHHKLKLVLFAVLSVVFSILMFPFSDLSDKITAIVSEQSGHTLYLQFDEMSFAMIPQPALQMSNVLVEAQAMPAVTVPELSVAPSILSLIRGKIGGSAQAEGLFEGDLDVDVSSSSRIKDPAALNVDLEFENFQLKELIKSLLPGPFSASGTGRIIVDVDVDPYMKSQPDGSFDMALAKMQMPSFSIPLGAMGSLIVPGINLEKVILKGTIKNGKLVIAETQLGSAKDDLTGRISGEIDLRVFPGGATNVGIYNLAVDLNMKPAFMAQLGPYAAIIDGFVGKYRSANANGVRYAFRIQANGFQDPAPNFTPL